MADSSALDVTGLLRAWTGGDSSAQEKLAPILWKELRQNARANMRQERAGHTLQATALVNEAFIRLVDLRRIEWRDRWHFFALASQMMRRILVDHARSRRYRKRGGGEKGFSLNDSAIAMADRASELIALDDALEALEKHDARKARVIEMRFFGGLSVEETAEALNASSQTVLRDWSIAKAWLRREMTKPNLTKQAHG
jgi:RNA polymerase sigma-70 factor (ECF subfamily)